MVSRTGDGGALVCKGNGQGLSTLTLRFQPEVPASASGTLVGGQASELFIHNVMFNLLRNPDVSVKQSPYFVSGSGPMLVADSQFFISSRNLWNHQVRDRVTFRNNFIDMHDGLGLSMSSEKMLVLNNELVFHPAAYAGQMNGFFLNEGWMGWNIFNAYVASNDAHDLNGPGDCQPYAADSAWSCLAGKVGRTCLLDADQLGILVRRFDCTDRLADDRGLLETQVPRKILLVVLKVVGDLFKFRNRRLGVGTVPEQDLHQFGRSLLAGPGVLRSCVLHARIDPFLDPMLGQDPEPLDDGSRRRT